MAAMQRNHGALWVLLALGPALAACGGKANEHSDPTDGITLQNFSSKAAASFCSALEGCCSGAKTTYNEGACVGQVTSYFEKLAGPAQASTRIAFDPSAAAACVRDLEAREKRCTNDFDSLTGSLRPDSIAKTSCDAVFKGTIAAGQACSVATECAVDPDPSFKSYADCLPDIHSSTNARICILFRDVLDTGASCSTAAGVVTQCKSHISCLNTTTNTCRDWVPAGGSCKDDDFCEPWTTYCDGTTCVALPNVGERCGPHGACASGLYCSANVCKASNTPTGAFCPSAVSSADNACPVAQRCSKGTCIVWGDAITTSSPSHLFDVTKRSCTLGPFAEALDDGGLSSQ